MAILHFYKRLILLPVILIITAYFHVLLLDTLPGNPESWLYASAHYANAPMFENIFPSVFSHFWSILHLNFGESYFLDSSVVSLIHQSLPQTFSLTLYSFLGLYPLAILLGISISLKHRLSTHILYIFTIIASLPSCLMYTLLYLFSIYPWFNLCPYCFAILFLIIRRIASLTSLILKSIEHEKQKKYVKAAYNREVPTSKIYIHYILKNGLRSIWVRMPKHFCHVLFSGTLMAEVLFSIPGFGYLSFISLKSQDYPLILGCILTASFSISLAYLLGDIIQYTVYTKRKC